MTAHDKNRAAEFARLSGQPVPDETATSAPAPGSDPQQYQAWGVDDNPQSMLRFHQPDGQTISALSYAYLQELITTSHQHLSLIYTNCVMHLSGRNLAGLVQLLQDSRVRSVQAFAPGRYNEPSPDQPIITEISRQSIRDFFAE